MKFTHAGSVVFQQSGNQTSYLVFHLLMVLTRYFPKDILNRMKQQKMLPCGN
jgi:hypothetical protein